MAAWTLYYDDGTTFSSTDGAPHESPPWGVVAVAQPDVEPQVMVNSDWLMWREDRGEWAECGSDGFHDHAAHYGHLIGCWRQTRWIRRKEFNLIWARAREDMAG